MSTFDEALAALPAPLRVRVEQCLVTWAADAQWGQVAANIRVECALASVHFEALLLSFAEELEGSVLPNDAWCRACALHEFCGPEMPAAKRPGVLGRAARVSHFATSINEQLRSISAGQVRRLVRKYAGKLPPPADERVLRAGSLGGKVIWATFHATDGGKDPFEELPPRLSALRTALGLGFHVDPELLVLTYRSTAPAHGLPLHRPTIADAGSYCYYRSHPDISDYHGYTGPLEPNSEGFRPLPEVVHARVKGAALILPFRIYV